MVKLAIDMASFNNVADANVIKDLQSAIVGNHETVRKYGVIISETRLKAQMLTMGLIKGKEAASEQAKVMARLSLILEGTTDAQGDAVRTAGSFANQMKALKAQITDLSKELGTVLLPRLTKFVKYLKDAVKWVRENKEHIMDTVIYYGKWAAGIFIAIKAIKLIRGAIRGLIAVYRALTAAKAIALALSGPKGWAVLAVGAVIAVAAVASINFAYKELTESLIETDKEMNQIVAQANSMAKELKGTAQAANTAATAMRNLKKEEVSRVATSLKDIRSGLRAAQAIRTPRDPGTARIINPSLMDRRGLNIGAEHRRRQPTAEGQNLTNQQLAQLLVEFKAMRMEGGLI